MKKLFFECAACRLPPSRESDKKNPRLSSIQSTNRSPKGDYETLLKGSWLVFAVSVIGSVILMFIPRDQAVFLTREGGWVENLSVAVLACGAVFAGLKLLRSRSSIWGAILLMFFWMYLRELDYQKLFTPRSIESIGLYSNPAVPLSLKLTAMVALAPFGLAGLYLLNRGLQRLRRDRASGTLKLTPLILVAVLFCTAIVSEKIFSPRFQIVEETAELGFVSLLTFFVAHSLFERKRNTVPAPG